MYPDDSRRHETLFQLADSYRGHAMQIDKQLDTETRIAPSERERLNDLRRTHFMMAIQHYTTVCQGDDTSINASRSRLEAELKRRSYLYQADSLVYLKDYPAAIEMYDFTARKYSLHHSSMYALVQIVNCYSYMGETDRSQAAHRRAMVRLEQLPPETFDAPDSLMDREAWERWLENSPVAPGTSASAMP